MPNGDEVGAFAKALPKKRKLSTTNKKSLAERMMQDSIARQEKIAQTVPVSDTKKEKNAYVARNVEEQAQHDAEQRLVNPTEFYSHIEDDKKRDVLIAEAERELDDLQTEAAFNEYSKHWLKDKEGNFLSGFDDAGNYQDLANLYSNWERHASGMDRSPSLGGVHPEAWIIGGMGANQLLKGAGELASPYLMNVMSAPAVDLVGNTIPWLTAENASSAYFTADAIRRTPNAANQWYQGNYGDALKETGRIAFDMMTPIGGKILKGTKQLASKGYNKVATGNSALPIAWKLEKPSGLMQDAKAILKNKRDLTPEESDVLIKYIESPHLIGEKGTASSKLFDKLIKEAPADFSKANAPVSKVDGYLWNTVFPKGGQSLAEGVTSSRRYGSTIKFPDNRSWAYDALGTKRFEGTGRTRFVIPTKHAKKLDFHSVNYNDDLISAKIRRMKEKGVKEDEIERTLNSSFNEIIPISEKEVIGNIPKGFKIIGKSNEGGYENIILKPNFQQGGEVMELTDKEIEKLKNGGPTPSYDALSKGASAVMKRLAEYHASQGKRSKGDVFDEMVYDGGIDKSFARENLSRAHVKGIPDDMYGMQQFLNNTAAKYGYDPVSQMPLANSVGPAFNQGNLDYSPPKEYKAPVSLSEVNINLINPTKEGKEELDFLRKFNMKSYKLGGEQMELTDKEIQELRKGGHIVIES
jgi:hypothetical protein